MRAFNRLLGLVTFSVLVAGCGQDFVGKIACNTDADCRTAERIGTLFDDASAPEFLPLCCSSICVLPAGGCDIQSDQRGYRYLNNDPGYGDCVKEDPMCPFVPEQDMSMPNSD
jgi:hypothetical protein